MTLYISDTNKSLPFGDFFDIIALNIQLKYLLLHDVFPDFSFRGLYHLLRILWLFFFISLMVAQIAHSLSSQSNCTKFNWSIFVSILSLFVCLSVTQLTWDSPPQGQSCIFLTFVSLANHFHSIISTYKWCCFFPHICNLLVEWTYPAASHIWVCTCVCACAMCSSLGTTFHPFLYIQLGHVGSHVVKHKYCTLTTIYFEIWIKGGEDRTCYHQYWKKC